MRPLIATAILATGLLVGCHSDKYTEMHIDAAGNLVRGGTYSKDDLWMRQVDQLTFNESRGANPPSGSPSWETFWRESYKDIRSYPGPTWPDSHFKDSEAMVTYIKKQRTTKHLPLYDSH